jgi:hypothetical protein
MFFVRSAIALLFPVFLSISCTSTSKKQFTRLSSTATGITFNNSLKETLPDFNVALYPYFYNGGGVAIGDINNDGLQDICFTGNMVKNRLYLNKGNMNFEDITDKAGINEKGGWSTGVTFTDINADGKTDLYVCRSGLPDSSKRTNLVYINNGDLSFTEQGAETGLDDAGYSTQSSFFDYDRDGDLDMFLINESDPRYARGTERVEMRKEPASRLLENKLFKNENGRFTNVSASAGIRSNMYSFSLGVNTADVNNDGWPDIYVSNDYKEPDYLYINNKNGTFTDSLTTAIAHTSLFGMGVDINDYNNDLLPDIVQMDMLSEDHRLQKMHMGFDNYDQYNFLFEKGLPAQYMKNSLQKNNGDGSFSEIAQLSGVSNTDWSWSALFADFDNDGRKDLFISNGYKRDITDLEFITFSAEQRENQMFGFKKASLDEYIQHMPGLHLSNYMMHNVGNDRFENVAHSWGLEAKTYSNGAAYADLDNDGDLDLVINNIDEEAGLYRNNAQELSENKYLKLRLVGPRSNPSGVGAKLILFAGKNRWYQEQNPVRGFQSCVDPVLHFGIGNTNQLDSLLVKWPDGKEQVIYNIPVNQTLELNNDGANIANHNLPSSETLFSTATGLLNFSHKENVFNDFTVQPLLPSYYSRSGPCMIKGDVNGDGAEDLFISGAKGLSSALFINKNGKFVIQPTQGFEQEKNCEDVAAAFFDADADGDLDLYIGAGGYEFNRNDSLLQDRLYLNDGNAGFTKAAQALPALFYSTSCVRPQDVDADGDIDLFIGGSVTPGLFPVAAPSTILLNNGKGVFSEGTDAVCTGLRAAGLITDAAWLDVNKDGKPDLVTVGEWCPVKVYINKNGRLEDASAQYINFPSAGLWKSVAAGDLDNDGDTDLIIGNQGWNNQFQASVKQPMEVYFKDFDENGSLDPIFCYYVQGKSYPAVSKDDLTQQLPFLRKKYLHYNDYADATIKDIFSPEQLEDAQTLKVDNLATVCLLNQNNRFDLRELPIEAQYAPVHSITIADLNKDGNKDVVLAGNNSSTRIKFSRYNANRGAVFLGRGNGHLEYLPQFLSGLGIKGDVRSSVLLDDVLFFAVNNQPVVSYRLK